MVHNLILNSGFEEYDSNGLKNWTCDIAGLITPPNLLICPIRDTTQKHSGTSSAYINISGNLDKTTGHIQQWVPVTPNTEYIFSTWFKAENFGGSRVGIHPAINLVEADFNYQVITTRRYYSNLKDPLLNIPRPLSFDWTYINGLINAVTDARVTSFITSPNTYYIKIAFGAWESYGKIWIDDINLYAKCEVSDCNFTIT